MIYYVKTDNTIQKYYIEINQEKLKELETDILVNCSKIKHFEEEYEGDYFWKNHDPKTTINVSYEKIGVKQYFEETVDIYKYSYDEIIISPLLDYIEKFKKEDSSVIDDIVEHKREEELLYKEMLQINKDKKETSIESEKEKLHKEMCILGDEFFRLDKERPYIDKMDDLLDIKEVKLIKIDQVNEVLEFFDQNDETKYGKVRML